MMRKAYKIHPDVNPDYDRTKSGVCPDLRIKKKDNRFMTILKATDADQ